MHNTLYQTFASSAGVMEASTNARLFGQYFLSDYHSDDKDESI